MPYQNDKFWEFLPIFLKVLIVWNDYNYRRKENSVCFI